jgi:5'-nucleotidase/UDP-sugar diphosphatase
VKWTIASIIVLAIAAGCSNQNRKSTAEVNPAVADITAPTPPAAPAAYAPPAPAAAVQPITYDTPQSSSGGPGGGKYTVRKGDTLWKIAQSKYGNGNNWQKIASANPGMDPGRIKAGQTIVIP